MYVHLNNDDVNQAIRDEHGLSSAEDGTEPFACAVYGTKNQPAHSDYRTCRRPLSITAKTTPAEKQRILERVTELEEQGVLDKLSDL